MREGFQVSAVSSQLPPPTRRERKDAKVPSAGAARNPADPSAEATESGRNAKARRRKREAQGTLTLLLPAYCELSSTIFSPQRTDF